ncbi:MAG: N-acetylmuramoyl-L-alanine amidase, partial [Propionibacteriaceae bacterium]|nr:N-acetylmuramoyl-L-alanine amidase [Propionibacteriaceae bacterium]
MAHPEVRELVVPTVTGRTSTTLAADGARRAGTVTAELAAKSTEKFSVVGVTWAPGTASTPQVEVRVRTDNRWSGWSLLKGDSDDAPDGAEAAHARPGTAPLWVGNSNGVQVRLISKSTLSRSAAPADVKVALVDPKTLATDATASSERLSGSSTSATPPYLYPAPAVVSRSSWGADETLRTYNGDGCATPSYDTTIKAAVVHHTAGSNSYSASQSASLVRGIYAYQVQSKGWCDIGYNFLVDKYGTTFEGRFGGIWNVVHGAHATLWNTNTVGVVVMGNFDTAQPPAVMMNAAANLIAWKLEGFYRDATGRVTLAGKDIDVITGHGDVMQTACPGRYLFAQMPTLRTTVKNKIGSFNTPIYSRWQALGGEAGWVGSPTSPERVILDGRATRFVGADLLWSPFTGAHWVKGGLAAKYRALGSAGHYLGFPTSDEEAGVLGSQMNRFQSGAIYSSEATGAQDVYRVFYANFTGLSADAQRNLGLPTASQRAGRILGSQYQPFSSGGMYWTKATGGHDIYRSFYAYYERLGNNVTRLGMPTASQRPGAVTGSQFQAFERGGLYWLSSLGTSEVNGQIFKTYQ